MNGLVGVNVADCLQRDVSLIVVDDGVVDVQAAAGLNQNAVTCVIIGRVGDGHTGQTVKAADFQSRGSIVADQDVAAFGFSRQPSHGCVDVVGRTNAAAGSQCQLVGSDVWCLAGQVVGDGSDVVVVGICRQSGVAGRADDHADGDVSGRVE